MRRGWQRRAAKAWDQGKAWKDQTNRRARRMDRMIERDVSGDPEPDDQSLPEASLTWPLDDEMWALLTGDRTQNGSQSMQ